MPQPTLNIVVFSNFEGFCNDPAEARRIVRGFEAISARHPDAIWTHMFNPIHLLLSGSQRECGQVFLAYLHDLAGRQPRTEVGLHLHMFYTLAQAAAVPPRSYPYAGAPADDCNQTRGMVGEGYDMLLTAYSGPERRQLIQKCVDAYVTSGLPRPTAFCAGYSATDPALQALLDDMGFLASFAAQAVPPGIEGVSYPPCWYKLLAWADHMTPLAKPYRVAVDSILPPAGPSPRLDHLVEIPLNTDTDIRPPYLHGRPISRKQILDMHYELVRITGRSSCVALGLHDVYLGDDSGNASGNTSGITTGGGGNPVSEEMAASLDHVHRLMNHGDVTIRFATASEVAGKVLAEPDMW